MKKEVIYILLILVMIFSFNCTNVYAQGTSIDSDRTEVKEVENNTIVQEKNDINSNSLNNPSDAINEENIEENDKTNSSSDINSEDSNENIEENIDEILTLDELNKLDDKLEFTEEILIVKGNLFDYTNTSLIKEIINKEEIISKYNLIIQFIDKSNSIIDEDIIIKDEIYLVLKNDTIEMKFKITFLFDFDENYIVNEEDKVKLLELMAEDSTIIESENLSYFDYALKNKTYVVPERGDISLDMEITTDKDRYDYEDEFDVIITNPQPPVEIIEEDKDNLPVENPTENNDSEIEESTESNVIIPEEEIIDNNLVVEDKQSSIVNPEENFEDNPEKDSSEEESTENNVMVPEKQEIDTNLVAEDNQSSSTDSDDNLEDTSEKNPSEEEKPSEDAEKDKKIYINIISGKIDYDHNALKLLSINFDDYKNLSTEEDSYLFWVDNLETIRIVLRFKVINQNSSEYIKIHDSDICSEGKEIETERMRAKVKLNKIPKPSPPKKEKKENKVIKTSKTEKKIIRKKRTDSYASKIDIKNHLIGFSYLVKNYTVKADYSETSLDFDIILRDKKYATYKITGNNNFKVGENLVVVTVTAEDGSTTDYKFNVIRMAKNIIHDKKTNNAGYDLLSMNIFLGALIVAIGLIYKLFSYKLNRY